MTLRLTLALLFTSALAVAAPSATNNPPPSWTDRPEVMQFIDEITKKHGFNRDELIKVLGTAQLLPQITRTMDTAAFKPRPWYLYYPAFVNATRINDGLDFWEDHAAPLKRARLEYGVPEEIILAILGVETRYGANTGNYRVLDTLSTLAFEYPRRAEFFRSELEYYLLLTRDEKMDPREIEGSFAGAMGIPQFMPSSYWKYGVDFNADGHRNLLADNRDAIASVANYFKQFGWESNAPVAVRAQISGTQFTKLLEEGLVKPQRSLNELKESGITPVEPLSGNPQALLFALETRDGPQYWLGFNNFYVITRYNRSIHYAMAVYQLAEELRALRQKAISVPAAIVAPSNPTQANPPAISPPTAVPPQAETSSSPSSLPPASNSKQ